ncbi:phage portal protein [Escherichia coli]|nr:phage portal protein [Escherichia coli]
MKLTPVLIDVNGVPLRESLSYNGGGAGFGGQMAEWLPPAQSADAALLPALRLGNARADDLVRNNGIAANAVPEMTVEKARPILAASPQADAGPSLRDQIMALDEAKGAEVQAEQLAACPGMTVESARAVLAAGSGKAEPVSASTTAMFEHFMANHSPAAVQGGVPQTSADGDADVKMLMAMP